MLCFLPRQYGWDCTGISMSIENNMLHLLCQTISVRTVQERQQKNFLDGGNGKLKPRNSTNKHPSILSVAG